MIRRLTSKPYAEKMDLVTYHWSGKHHDVVKGINLITLLWSDDDDDDDGKALIPIDDFRLYDTNSQGGLQRTTTSGTCLEKQAKEGWSRTMSSFFDSWYSSIDNLKAVRHYMGGISLRG